MRLLGGEGGARGIEILGVDVRRDALDGWQRGMHRALCGLGGFVLESVLQFVQFRGGLDAVRDDAGAHAGNRIEKRVGFAFGGGTVALIVVRKRVGMEADAVAVHQCRPAAGTAMRRSSLKSAQADDRVVAIDLGNVKVGEVGHKAGDASARRIHLDGSADRVAVVLDHEDYRQLLVRSGIQRLPELALRR
jgi:hypothetical protein